MEDHEKTIICMPEDDLSLAYISLFPSTEIKEYVFDPLKNALVNTATLNLNYIVEDITVHGDKLRVQHDGHVTIININTYKLYE